MRILQVKNKTISGQHYFASFVTFATDVPVLLHYLRLVGKNKHSNKMGPHMDSRGVKSLIIDKKAPYKITD